MKHTCASSLNSQPHAVEYKCQKNSACNQGPRECAMSGSPPTTSTLSFQAMYDEYATETREKTDSQNLPPQHLLHKEHASPNCFRAFLLSSQPIVEETQRTIQRDGFSRMADCRAALDILDTLGWNRSYHQRVFHDNYIRASARVFFKMDPPGAFARAHQKILDLNGWDTLSQEILISTPRRFGKTISVSMFAAAMLFSCTNIELSIYSTCKRISQKLLQNVQRFILLVYKGLGKEPMRIIRSNMEELVVQGPDSATDIRTINSYPSKVMPPNHSMHTHIHTKRRFKVSLYSRHQAKS